ncbi:MAG TPA: HlyD family efflux transporter periplasmic adaptor subunit, partial [Allocoleopsis sp.]
SLIAEGAVNQQEFDQTQTALETAEATYQAQVAAVEAARQQLSAAQGGLTQSQTAGLNPTIRNTQLDALLRRRQQSEAQLKVAQAQLKAAEARIEDAKAAKQEIETQLKDSEQDLNVVSPLDGIVTARSVEPGAVVDSQSKLLTLIDPQTVYLRGFLPQGEIGSVRVGQTVRVYLDSAPKQPLDGQVIAIDPQASFTPENIYFQQDRVKQVVGIRISVNNPKGCNNPTNPYVGDGLPCAMQGMPADAEILLKSTH